MSAQAVIGRPKDRVTASDFLVAGKVPKGRHEIPLRLADREPRDNARYVVTNLSAGPKHLYENIYCQRGEIERCRVARSLGAA
jgi:hypothetical protein